MRTFIAIELSEAARAETAGIQKQLIESHSDVKWVKPENIHLTLKFLGNVPDDTIEEVKAAMKKAAALFSPFTIELKTVGAFPDTHNPRVIFISGKDNEDNLSGIASRLEDELSRVGFAKEARQFRSHFTLGRVRSSKNIDKLKHMFEGLQQKENQASWQVTEMVLFRSDLTQAGPIYTPLFSAPFVGLT